MGFGLLCFVCDVYGYTRRVSWKDHIWTDLGRVSSGLPVKGVPFHFWEDLRVRVATFWGARYEHVEERAVFGLDGPVSRVQCVGGAYYIWLH